jgi:hypothetical protein
VVGAPIQDVLKRGKFGDTSCLLKKTAANTGGRLKFNHRVEEKRASLAGLAATYSSKP